MSVNSYRDLDVWKKSMDLTDSIYEVCLTLPNIERYVLADQLRRAAISIPSNIAEGSKRGSRADFRQFCRISLGSAAEVETQLLIVQRRYPDIPIDNELDAITNIEKMLTKLIQRLGESPKTTN